MLNGHIEGFRFKVTAAAVTAILLVSAAVQPVLGAKAKPKPKPKPKPASKVVVSTPAPAAPKVVKVVDVYAADPVTLKQTGSVIQVSMAPEEYEPAPLLVKSPKAIPAAKVTVFGDLVAGGSKLAKSNISAWVVSDGVLRKDATSRVTGDPTADLQAGTQAFWLRVYAPKGTKPGTYKGYVVVSTDKTIGSIPIEVTVRSMRLLTSSKQYGMLVPVTVAAVGDETYRAYLSEVRGSGMSVSALPEPPESAAGAFTAYKASGLLVHGLYAGFLCAGQPLTFSDIEGVSSVRKTSGAAELFFLGADRPADETAISEARTKLASMKAAGVRTAARVDTTEAYDGLAEYLNAVIYKTDVPYVQSLTAGTAKRTNGKREWWYWDASKDAMENRINSGLLLWKSGLDGAYIEPGQVDYNSTCDSGNYSLIVPGENGVMPTVKWDVLREGIDDTRYITTLMNVVREAKDQKVAKDTTEAAEAYLAAFLSKPFNSLTYQDFEKFQAQCAQYIIKLRSVVKS